MWQGQAWEPERAQPTRQAARQAALQAAVDACTAIHRELDTLRRCTSARETGLGNFNPPASTSPAPDVEPLLEPGRRELLTRKAGLLPEATGVLQPPSVSFHCCVKDQTAPCVSFESHHV